MKQYSVAACALGMTLIGSLATSTSANVVQFTAFGSDMHGGRLTIDFMPGPGAPIITMSAPILAVGPGHGQAIIPDPFGNPFPGAIFDCIGETFSADWTLRNLADASIIRAHFDLAGSISLFDDDSNPSSTDSSTGLAGVAYNPGLSTAPQEIAAFEGALWGDAKNAGDMYVEETILWPLPDLANPWFIGGLTYVWNDDTDVIPAPGAVALLGLAGLAAVRRRRP